MSCTRLERVLANWVYGPRAVRISRLPKEDVPDQDLQIPRDTALRAIVSHCHLDELLPPVQSC